MIGPQSGPMLQQAVSALALPSGVRVWLACGHTDMRKGMDGLAMLAQEVLNEDPFGGALFAFRGKRGGLVKLLWFDGQGMCLFSKRLERGHFVWPVTGTGRASLRRHSCRCCSRVSIGERRSARVFRTSPVDVV
jgi:transposase